MADPALRLESLVKRFGGVTAVDWCESHEAEARRICVDGTAAVREAAEAIGAHVVFFSTDYVFSGKAGPYKVTDPPDAINVYGRVKAQAEKEAGPFAVIRTSMVFSDEPDSKNFHNFVRDTLRGGGVVRAFTDQTGNPTYAPPLATVAIAVMGNRLDGIMHVAGPEVLTRFEFARRVARAYGLDEGRLKPVTSEEMPMPAARPKRGGLVLDDVADLMLSVDQALDLMSKRNKTRL